MYCDYEKLNLKKGRCHVR